MPDTLTLNKITAQRGISIGEATRRIADLGWTPSYVQEAMTFPTDYKIKKSPRDPMKQVLRSYFPMQEEKDNRVYGALDAALRIRRQIGPEDDVVGPGQGQVTQQDGGRNPEPVRGALPIAAAVQRGEADVNRWLAAAGGGVVDDVVMHQSAGVQQLQRGKQQQHFGIGLRVGHRTPSPIREGGPQPLAAAQHKVFQRRDQGSVVTTDVRGVAAPVVQVSAKLVGNGAGQLDGCRCIDAQRGAPFCSACPRWSLGPISVFAATPV